VSLIQEALKRQREDMESPGKTAEVPSVSEEDKGSAFKLKVPQTSGEPENAASSADGAAPAPGAGDDQGSTVQPPSLPASPRAAERLRKLRKPLIIAAIAICVLLVLTGVIILAKGPILKLLSGSPKAPPEAAATKQTPPTPLPPALPPAIAPTSAVPAVVQLPPAVIPPITQPASNVTVNPPIPPDGTPVAVKPEPPTQKEPVVWPILTLKGLLKGSRSAAAKINNAIVSVGEEIDGAKVIAITSDAVTLQYKGATCVLRSGDSTK